MRAFDYARAESASEAVRLVQSQPQAKFLGGGTNLVDLMRERIELPGTLIDVTGLSREIAVRDDGRLLIGAFRCLRGQCWPVHPVRSATWRLWAAT